MAHPSPDCPAKGQPLLSTSGGFVRVLLTGSMLGREDDSGTGEKHYWRARICNSAQMGLVRSAGRVKRRPVAYEPMCQPWMPVQSVVREWVMR